MPEAEFDGTILFIDDDATGREVATYNLANAGFAVEAAGDGEEGLARFDPERHAVVVTDLKMPRIDGMEVFELVFGMGLPRSLTGWPFHDPNETRFETLDLRLFRLLQGFSPATYYR